MPTTELGIALVVIGTVLACRWQSIALPLQVIAIGFMVVGVIVLSPIAGDLLSGRSDLNLAPIQHRVNPDIGRRLLRTNKRIFDGPYAYRPAKESDFAELDRFLYDATTREMIRFGCRTLGDVVSSSVERSDRMSGVTRIMLSADGRTIFSITHLVLSQPSTLHPSARASLYESHSRFDDGSFLLVNNSKASSLFRPPPKLRKIVLEPVTAASDVLKRHEAELADLASQQAIRHETLDDALASLLRGIEIYRAFKHEIGYLDTEGVRKHALLKFGSQEVADLIAKSAEEARRFELASRRSKSPTAEMTDSTSVDIARRSEL